MRGCKNDYEYWRREWEDECKMRRLKHGDGPESWIYLGGSVYEGTEADWGYRYA